MLNVHGLEFMYPHSKKQVLKGLDFSVKRGQILGFLGPSGAGKSTTQKILTGIQKNYLGSVQLMGLEIKKWDKGLYEQIGVCFEFPSLYQKLTALENLNLIRSFYGGKTQEPQALLALVGLDDKAKLKVSQFSKGMKMRLNFVRAFIHNPELIFLDEPTTGLDPGNARRIKNIILEQKAAGKTIFLTTHNMNVADELCDQVAFLVDGELKLIDSPSSLKQKYGQRKVMIEFYEDSQVSKETFKLDKIGYNQAFIDVMQHKEIKTMHTQEATLEDVFIQTTGRKLR